MVCAEVWIWVIVPFDTVRIHGYEAHIGVVHEILLEEVRTVIYLEKLSTQRSICARTPSECKFA